LQVQNLQVAFPIKGALGQTRRFVTAVDDVSFTVKFGETLGLVGESGCGKTTLARTLLRLIKPRSGQIIFQGRNITHLPQGQLRRLRRGMQIIFQNPDSALNPRMTVGAAITEPMQIHHLSQRPQSHRQQALELLAQVKLEADALNRYPHEFSGGQRQRICIARALALKPSFVICDESVSALDVSVQAEVLNLLKELQQRLGLTYIFISHDLSVVKFMSDRIMVMNKGKVEEIAPAAQIYTNPKRDYTRKLIAAIPQGKIT
jgi:peptide/nickel transport system ATP-binding protein